MMTNVSLSTGYPSKTGSPVVTLVLTTLQPIRSYKGAYSATSQLNYVQAFQRSAHIPCATPEEEASRARSTHLVDGVPVQGLTDTLALSVALDSEKHASIVLVRVRAVMFVLRYCEKVLELRTTGQSKSLGLCHRGIAKHTGLSCASQASYPPSLSAS